MIRHQACDKYCVFIGGSDWYALPALAVREVASCPTLFRVPASDGALAGICHLRNEFLVIVRLDLLQGREPNSCPRPRQLLILPSTAGAWGLLVDEVVALESLETSMRTEIDRESGHLDTQMGAATYRDNFVRLLDPHRLYLYAEQQLRATWASGPEPTSRDGAPDMNGSQPGDKS